MNKEILYIIINTPLYVVGRDRITNLGTSCRVIT